MFTAEYLRQELHYDPDTGAFRWLKRKGGRQINREPGNMRADGYRRIGINGKPYLTHRLAWLYMTGEWPEFQIDHIDGNPANNKFSNLRDVRGIVNHQNIRKSYKSNKSGFLGVSYHERDDLWRARIMVNGKDQTLGYFKKIEDASQCYLEAKRKAHSGCTI